MRAIIAQTVDKDGGRPVYTIFDTLTKIVPDLRGIDVRSHLAVKTCYIQVEQLRIGEQIFILKLLLMGEEQITHLGIEYYEDE